MPLKTLLKRRRVRDAAGALYGRAVEQARRPDFYLALGVPDTLDGRFDLLALHVFLILHRLKTEGAAAAELAQAVFDLMFDDMDQNLREIGVGDLGVGRRVKAMARALYGRIGAYEQGLAEGDSALAAALKRNLYGTTEPDEGQVAANCLYLRREAASLAAQPLDALANGVVEFGAPPRLPVST